MGERVFGVYTTHAIRNHLMYEEETLGFEPRLNSLKNCCLTIRRDLQKIVGDLRRVIKSP